MTGKGFGASRGLFQLKSEMPFRQNAGLLLGGSHDTGKTLFAQDMDFLPWKTFHRIVARSTLADANELRDRHIWECFAGGLIIHARELYVSEDFGLDLSSAVYALDSTTIDLCLSVFPWAHFRTTKASMKMHSLLDLKGNLPSFIHASDGKLHNVRALDLPELEAGAIYLIGLGYVDFARLHTLHLAGVFFVTRIKSNMDFHRIYSAPTDRDTGIICDRTIALDGFYTKRDYPAQLRRV